MIEPNFWLDLGGWGVGMVAARRFNHDGDDGMAESLSDIADALERNPRRNGNGGGMWSKPVSIGQLIVSILGLGVTIFGGLFVDRLTQERNLTQLSERQNSVITVYLPQLRQEIADLQRTAREHDAREVIFQKQIDDLRIDQIKHERDDVQRFRGRVRTSEPWDK